MLVVGAPPAAAAGAGGDDAVVAALVAHPRAERVATPCEAVARLGTGGGWITGDVPLLVRREGGDAVVLVSGAVPNASRFPCAAPASSAGTTTTSTGRATPRRARWWCARAWPRRRPGTPPAGRAPR